MKLSDRLDKLHDDKLIPVLESFLERDREQDILNVLPHLRKQRPHFNERFDAIQSKAQEALAAHTVVEGFEPVRTERCQNCGYSMRQYSPQSLAMTCESCGTVLGDSSPPDFVAKSRNPLFALHKTFTYQNRLWQVIGWQRYSGFSKEWDSEDKVWESTPWQYETWWVMNQKRELAWISQDKEGYTWARKTKATGGKPKVSKSHELGYWKLNAFQGEFSYFPRAGERVESYERYNESTEVLYDEHNMPKEIEAFKSIKISPREILIAFDQKDKLQKINRTRSAMLAIAMSVILLLAGYVGLKYFGKEVMSSGPTDIQNQLLSRDQQLGSFSLNTKSVIGFQSRIQSIKQKGSFNADYLIKDNESQEVAKIPISFWYDQGRDSDGLWSESAFKSSQSIKIPAGENYQLWISPDNFKNWSAVKLNTKVTKNEPSITPILIAFLPLVFLLFIVFLMQTNALKNESGISA